MLQILDLSKLVIEFGFNFGITYVSKMSPFFQIFQFSETEIYNVCPYDFQELH